MSEWQALGEDWQPQAPETEYDKTWPYNWKWGVSAENQVSVWRVKGGTDGRPTHRDALEKLWGRPVKVGDGDVLGLAMYRPAEMKLDGTVVAPALIQLQTYYNQPTPPQVYSWFHANFPDVQVVEATIVKPRLAKIAGDFDEWRKQQENYTNKTLKWAWNEEEDPKVLLWEVEGQDGYPLHPQMIEKTWGRPYNAKDSMGYGDFYPESIEVENYGRIKTRVLQDVVAEMRQRYPNLEINTSRARTENEAPEFADVGNIPVISAAGLWARDNLKVLTGSVSERSGRLQEGWEAPVKVSGWGDPESPDDQLGIGRELRVVDGMTDYPLDEYEAQLLQREGLITPRVDYEVDDLGYPKEIPGLYELTARMWDDYGMMEEQAWDYFDDMLGRNKDSDEQERFTTPNEGYFSPASDSLLYRAKVGLKKLFSKPPVWEKESKADMDGAMIALFIPKKPGAELKQPGGEPIDNMHITLIYFQDKADDRDDWDEVERIVEQFARQHPVMNGTINGFGVFYNDEDVLWATPSINGLAELRSELLEAVEDAGFPVSSEHDWVPHITLKYGWSGDLPELDEPVELEFEDLTFARGEDKQHFAFLGAFEKEAGWGDTTQLQQGDIVWDNGMRLLIDQPMQLSRNHPGNSTFWTRALVTNPEDVKAAGVVPWGWIVDESRNGDDKPRWTIQGNEKARWGVEPRLDALDKQAGWTDVPEEEPKITFQDQQATVEMLKEAMKLWNITDPRHPKFKQNAMNVLYVLYENEPGKAEAMYDWFMDSFLGENNEVVDSQGWISFEPKRGSRYGFVMLAADISELAAKARQGLLSREDIATMNQQWHPDYVAWQTQPDYPNMAETYQGQTANPKHDPQKYKQVERILNYLPDELYKYYPWAVNRFKKNDLDYYNLQHVRDILTQFRNHTEYLRTTPRNAPTWEASPDINQMPFGDVQSWVYMRNSKGVDPRPETTWEVENKDPLEDGYYITPVTTKADLAQEGDIMGHCVGGYCNVVKSGDTTIWSLRDAKGESHVTIEMTPNNNGYGSHGYRVVQIQGKSNQEPKPEYQRQVQLWFERKKAEGWDINASWEIETVYDLEEWWNNFGQGTGMDAYGLPIEVYFDYHQVADEIVTDALSGYGDPDYDLIRAYESAADESGNSRDAIARLEELAEAELEQAMERVEDEFRGNNAELEREYEEYVNDVVREENDRRYEEDGDDYEEADESSVNVPRFEEWVEENYRNHSDAENAVRWNNGEIINLEEYALEEIGWSRWW